MYTTPIVNSKAAEEHIAKIKAEHSDLIVDMLKHKEQMANEKMLNEQKDMESSMMQKQEQAEQKRMETEMMKQKFEQDNIKNEQAMKQQELSIKMKALSATE